MTKTQMPKPEAWVKPEHLERIKHWNGVVDAKNITLYSRERQGTVPIITTTQAEDYKDACVREALEEAATLCETDGVLYTGLDMAGPIRALIPITK